MPGSMSTPGLELALSSIRRRVDSVFERTLGPVILQPILPVELMPESVVHISVAACDRLLLLCDGKPSTQACAEAAKKWHKQVIKKRLRCNKM